MLNTQSVKNYRRWEHVSSYWGSTVCATKRAKDGSNVQLLINDGGKTRHLRKKNSDILDIVDSDGVKRVYTYDEDGKGGMKAKMFTSESEKSPLVRAANWVSEKFHLKELSLELNPNHKEAEMFIPASVLENKNGIDTMLDGKSVRAKRVVLKDFEDKFSLNPKTILVETVDGKQEKISTEIAEDMNPFVKNLGVSSEPFGERLFTCSY